MEYWFIFLLFVASTNLGMWVKSLAERVDALEEERNKKNG